MPISQLDLAKFQEYKARQKTTSRSVPASTNSQNPNSQKENGQNGQNSDGEKLPDLISFCVEDIASRAKDVDQFLIFEWIVSSAITVTENNLNEEQKKWLSKSLNEKELAEIILDLFDNKDIFQTFFLALIFSYAKLCFKLNLEPQEDILAQADIFSIISNFQ